MIPAYREEVRVVPMGDSLASSYDRFARAITEQLAALEERGDTSGRLPWLQSLLFYPDMPWVECVCRTKSGVTLGSAPALYRDVMYSLEQELLAYVREQFEQSHPLIVCTENSAAGPYDDQGRMKACFERLLYRPSSGGAKVKILRRSVPIQERQEWVDQCATEGVDIVICNPSLLVELNLSYFTRLAFKRFPLHSAAFYSAARCLNRPQQSGNVETAIFVYEGSLALRLLRALAFSDKALDTEKLVAHDAFPLETLLEGLVREAIGQGRSVNIPSL